MAECGDLSRSVEGASDAIHDYICSSCNDKGRNTEALVYCEQCVKHLCGTCNELHRTLFSKHVILGKDKIDQWGCRNRNVAMDMCEIHSDKEADMFCHDHNEICCYVCIATNHRICKLVQHLPDVAKGIHKKPEVQEMLASVSKLKARLNEMIKMEQTNKKQVQQATADIISKIKALRHQINETLDALESKTLKIVDFMLADMEKTLGDNIDVCQSLHGELKELTDSIHNREMPETSVFRAFKKCEKESKNAEDVLQYLQDAGNSTITFTPNNDIEDLLSTLDTLGNVVSNHALAATSASTATAPGLAAVPKGTAHIYNIEHVRKFNVRTRDDTNRCDITGICQLPSGNYVVTDCDNSKVKLLNANFTVINYCTIPPYLHDVCHITNEEVAVPVFDRSKRREIYFINTTDRKLTVTRIVKLTVDCTCVSYQSGNLYVGSYKSLDAYMLASTPEKLYKAFVDHVAVSDDGNRIYFTKWDGNSIVTLDNTGKELSTLNVPELKTAGGVTVIGHGGVFVSGAMSDTILQIDREGKRILATVATEGDGVHYPLSLHFDRKKSELIVGQRSDNELLVIKLR